MDTWHFFLAHAGPDGPRAAELSRQLRERAEVRVFLDSERIPGGAAWHILKPVLLSSRVIVVLVSQHSDAAYYQREEVALAIELLRMDPKAYRVVPVYLKGAKPLLHAPYGTFQLHALQEDAGGLQQVAAALLEVLHDMPRRASTRMLAHATQMLDRIWSGAEAVLTNREERLPEEFRMRFLSSGDDIVAVGKGTGAELQRVTREEFEKRFTAEQLVVIETLERSMEVNAARWQLEYPQRASSDGAAAQVERLVKAMAEDLEAVLSALEKAGLWLDDHYMMVRHILGVHGVE